MQIYNIECNKYYDSVTTAEAIDIISNIYHKGDVVLGELFSSVQINEATIEEVIDIAKALRKRIDGIDNIDYKE